VNDRYTHRIGDLLLAEVAARLRQSMNPGATACRLGGDEFCVFLSGRLTEQDAEQMADRILSQLRRPACIEGIVIHPSASIGISFHAAVGIDLKDLLRTADQAMYRAKAVKGGGVLSSVGLAAA
jgi:diguanylate cyclase (GGDEF)-like protein